MRFVQGFLLGLVLAAIFSWHSTPAEKTVELSSSDIPSIEDNLPCVSEVEYQEILQELKYTTQLEGGLCDGSNLDKFARTLAYMRKLNLPATFNWTLAGKTSIRHPYQFMKRRIHNIDFDAEQSSVAYQSRSVIHLGPYFFEKSLLGRIETLYHETQHANPMSPLHINCVSGDRMQELGACDQDFSVEEDAGAYSFSVAMDYALIQYNPDLTEDDKDELYSNIQLLLGSRFSHIPSLLANPIEQILVLNKNKELGRLHPFLNEIVPFQLENGEVWESVSPDIGNNGVWLKSTSDHIWSWNPSTGEYFQILPTDSRKDLHTIDIQYLNIDTAAYPHFVDEQKQIYQINEEDIRSLDYNLSPFKPVQLAQGPRHSFYFLNEDGQIVQYKNKQVEVLPSQNTFQFLQAGITFSEIYGITKEGILQSFVDQQWQDSDFKLSQPAVKYQESTSFRALLDSEGTLHSKYYNVDIPETSIAKNLKDFTVVRKYAFTKTVTRKNELATLPCPARITYKEPWLGTAVGINDKDQLVFANHEGTCIAFLEQVSAVSFETQDDKLHVYGYGIPYMRVVFLNGPAKAYFPYTHTILDL